MPKTIRFHLDENSSKAIAVGLRHHGIEVTTTPEVGLIGATDEEQVAHARLQSRVIFTQDRDFLFIAQILNSLIGCQHPLVGPSRQEFDSGLDLRVDPKVRMLRAAPLPRSLSRPSMLGPRARPRLLLSRHSSSTPKCSTSAKRHQEVGQRASAGRGPEGRARPQALKCEKITSHPCILDSYKKTPRNSPNRQ